MGSTPAFRTTKTAQSWWFIAICAIFWRWRWHVIRPYCDRGRDMDPSMDDGIQETRVWCGRGRTSRRRKKKKIAQSAGKVMTTLFWDRKGVLLIDYQSRRTTITAAHYCEVLRNLRRAIQNKRGKLSKKVFLFHDNARPHSARETRALLEQFEWNVYGHPPYSPDLAPSDFLLFPQLKHHLREDASQMKMIWNKWRNVYPL